MSIRRTGCGRRSRAVDWWAVMTAADGSVESIAGTSLLLFDHDGLVVEQRDVWASEPGSRDLPDWAPGPRDVFTSVPSVATPDDRRHDMTAEGTVRELRLCVTAPDYDDALHFYRDVLGLRERVAYASADGRVSILDAGRATLELTDTTHAEFIDRVEVGRRVAGHIRVAFEDSAATTELLAAAGANIIAEPTRTPWNSLNARLEAPAGLQLTLFTELGTDETPPHLDSRSSI